MNEVRGRLALGFFCALLQFGLLQVLCLAGLLGGSIAIAQTSIAGSSAKRPMQFEDLMGMRRVGDPQISPDGKWVLFSAVDVSLRDNTKISHLWIVPAPGGDAKPITASQAGESRGRFSPDGSKILFTSSRTGTPQLYVAPFDGAKGDLGEAVGLTSISTGADGALWSPDGAHVLFVSEVYPDCADDACNQQRDQVKKDGKVKATLLTHLLYRHWNSYTGDKRSHIFVVGAAGGTPRDVTPASLIGDHETPPFSLGGSDDYAWSPDGKEIAYTVNLDSVPAISTNNDVFTLAIFDAQGQPIANLNPRKISNSPGGDSTPRYSPDGKWIAFRSQARAGYESDRFRLALYNRQSGEVSYPLPKYDRWIDEIVWYPASSSIAFTSANAGEEEVRVYQIDAGKENSQDSHQESRLISKAGEFGDVSVSADGNFIVASRMTVQAPSEIVRLDHGKITQLTHLNDKLLAEVDLPAMEPFWFRGALGARVEGFVLKPPSFDPTKKYPVKFLIHGGPQGAWGDAWSYRWNPELFAASGYVVVMINPRGSTGYGQAFIDGINGDWGGKPYVDLMRGLDAAEVKYSFIDKARECALGASYGGYMANWILGHTNRFACIVSHDGMFNTESAYGTTEELWFNEWEFKGKPWTDRLLYRRWSPALSAPNFKSPTLVIHGQLDYRLDVSQGLDLFTTLQRLNVPSEMLYFPDEGHWVLKPQNSQLWYRTVSAWVDKWTHTNQPAAAAN